MAITNKKIIYYETYAKNINGIIFKNIIKNIVPMVKGHYFLLDNINFHKSKEIENIINASGNYLLFLPPYSPQFNPVEEVFSFIKTKLCKSNDLNKIRSINKIIGEITGKHLKNYFNDCLKNKI